MARIQESGTLIRENGGFALRRDGGGILALELDRVPVDHVEKRVRITGELFEGEARVAVDGLTAG